MSRVFAIQLWILIALFGCSSQDTGSGGGIGGSGITPLEANGATLGSITAFGSIVVNGVRFDTDNATFFMNDREISQNDLRIGMNVLTAVNFSSNIANQVNYVPSLIGPVESVDMAEGTFQSMGQTVVFGSGTSFENISSSEISPGLVLEVSGLRDATGRIFATFLRLAEDVSRYQLVGTVLSELGDSQQFSLSGLQVDFSQADLSQISTEELEFGDKVYVTAGSSNYDAIQPGLIVDTVRVALEPMVSAGDRVEYEGIVSTLTSPFEFTVNWQPIIATDQTRVEYIDGTLGDLNLIMENTRLEVEGIVQADGAYLASRVILKD